jgi:hypothetical protein
LIFHKVDEPLVQIFYNPIFNARLQFNESLSSY